MPPLIVWLAVYSRLRNVLKAPFVLATGTVSRRAGTMNIVVQDARALRVLEAAPGARDFR